MRKGQIVEIHKGYRKKVFGQKYGVISDLKLYGNKPILEITIPLENGMRIKADLDRGILKPIEENEVKL